MDTREMKLEQKALQEGTTFILILGGKEKNGD
jgi:hypothetical protein